MLISKGHWFIRTISVNTDKHLPNIDTYFILCSQRILWWPVFSRLKFRDTDWAQSCTVPCIVLWKDWEQPEYVEINADYSTCCDCLTVCEHKKNTKPLPPPEQLCVDDRGLKVAVDQSAWCPYAEKSCPVSLQFQCSYDLFTRGIRPAQDHWICLLHKSLDTDKVNRSFVLSLVYKLLINLLGKEWSFS